MLMLSDTRHTVMRNAFRCSIHYYLLFFLVSYILGSGGSGSSICRFYIALFSALEQTHCSHVACDSDFFFPFFLFFFFSFFFFLKARSLSSAMTALFGCYTAGAT